MLVDRLTAGVVHDAGQQHEQIPIGIRHGIAAGA
jgi:hypothetical protein